MTTFNLAENVIWKKIMSLNTVDSNKSELQSL